MLLSISIGIEFNNDSIMERLCTLNTATLSTQAPKQNTLNHLRSFKVTHFEVNEKPRGTAYYCNNVGFRVGNFEGKI